MFISGRIPKRVCVWGGGGGGEGGGEKRDMGDERKYLNDPACT